ncbi:mitochondrial ribosomal protein S18C [Dermatophagoides pteronyssinus]|uniref:28S ribosomal protein S18c, mitochondrial n=2 Tax=Dermatophagoides pteronyssinus TaxID=6956 RepID=A0ABQ8J084_DERPT|nr:28S ribosomal protein S18c, mitochondrial-like [Dermatophagoides pteronyssinus]KAH9415937.1 28S ribosomal protein S18c, mitochondrial [Dermatophagoides pteronyssinus]
MKILTNLAFSVLRQKCWTTSTIFNTSRLMCSKSSEPKSCHDEDLPDPNMTNPYLKEKPQCILCRYGIEIDYKNVRLLSQFVSPYTGRMYDKHITGLCERQHRAVRKEHSRAVRFGLMSMFYRDPKYNNDPKLFDPTRPQRANPY